MNQQRGFIPTIIIIALITTITLMTSFAKTLFVAESGNIEVYGWVGVLLAFGLIRKWKYARTILLWITAATFVLQGISVWLDNSGDKLFWNILLFIILGIILYLLNLKSVKDFQKNDASHPLSSQNYAR